LEDYLRGVVPNEMPTGDRSILEALKAQAVAARTYAMTHLNQFPDLDFDMYSDERDQVYKGANTEQYISDKAVAETAGLLLSFKGRLAKCFYHSTCGGATANINEVWSSNPVPYLTSLSDKNTHKVNFCRKSSYTHWFESWNREQLTNIIKANLKKARADKQLDFTRLLNMKVEKQTKSGRVETLQITTDKGIIRVKGDKTRWALRRKTPDGPILFSSWFSIVKFGPEILVRGRGFGHGIGMCQFGAMGRARTGKAFYEILPAYYKGTKLVKMNLE
jgi:stage II sporulation protein D